MDIFKDEGKGARRVRKILGGVVGAAIIVTLLYFLYYEYHIHKEAVRILQSANGSGGGDSRSPPPPDGNPFGSVIPPGKPTPPKDPVPAKAIQKGTHPPAAVDETTSQQLHEDGVLAGASSENVGNPLGLIPPEELQNKSLDETPPGENGVAAQVPQAPDNPEGVNGLNQDSNTLPPEETAPVAEVVEKGEEGGNTVNGEGVSAGASPEKKVKFAEEPQKNVGDPPGTKAK